MTGNGGDAGFVYYQDMLLPIAKYGYAISSTVSERNSVFPFCVPLQSVAD